MDANILSKAGSLVGDPSRATILWSLLGGESRPASELALLANVSQQTASNHLKLLLDSGFLKVTLSGRNRFYRLSGSPVATALESLAAATQAKKLSPSSAQKIAPDLVFARTCYDHLAGELGVAILNRLRQMDYLRAQSGNYRLTPAGEKFLGHIGFDLSAAQATRRRFAYACLDWSHRVPHLGGALGAALLEWLFRTRAVVRLKNSRAVRLTDAGQRQLHTSFAIRVSRLGRAIESGPLRD